MVWMLTADDVQRGEFGVRHDVEGCAAAVCGQLVSQDARLSEQRLQELVQDARVKGRRQQLTARAPLVTCNQEPVATGQQGQQGQRERERATPHVSSCAHARTASRTSYIIH